MSAHWAESRRYAQARAVRQRLAGMEGERPEPNSRLRPFALLKTSGDRRPADETMTAMAVPRLTTAQLDRVIASLRGLRITGVDYAPLTAGTDGHDVPDWDYGAWHEPTMGIQLHTDIGTVFTLTWGNSFGCYGLETHDRSINEFLACVGEPCGPLLVPVGDHPHWRALLGREIIGTELAWVEWTSSDPTPCWLRLDLAPEDGQPSSDPASVWICAGRWERDRFAFATDDVTVIFDPAEAARTKIMTTACPSEPSTRHDENAPILSVEECGLRAVVGGASPGLGRGARSSGAPRRATAASGALSVCCFPNMMLELGK